jgi:hypothetical protein
LIIIVELKKGYKLKGEFGGHMKLLVLLLGLLVIGITVTSCGGKATKKDDRIRCSIVSSEKIERRHPRRW